MPLVLSDLGSAFELLLRQYVDEREVARRWKLICGLRRGRRRDDANFRANGPARGANQTTRYQRSRHDGIAKLRAVALKDLRCKLPSTHDSWEITDGFGDDLEMFWQILEFVGLADFARETERIKAAVESQEGVRA